MKRLLIFPLSALLLCSAVAEIERSYINDKKAPENRKDLETIEKALKIALPKVRAATVCVEIKEGSGSGVIISEDGLILTAAHVATAVKKKVTVILEDGTKLKAETLGLVAGSDAAMIQITEKGNYPFVEIDRTAATRLGDWVFALGHSGGFDKDRGLVARLGRLVRVSNATYQSDCTLIGGDSGGPLFDLSGKLIAIHSRVGKNLPENMHVPMAEYIDHWEGMKKGEFIGEGPFAKKPEKGRGILGIATENLEGGGLRITGVGEKTPAEEAGILQGDKLIKLNDTVLKNRQQMQDMLKEMAAGDEVILEIERDGKPKTFTLNLGER